MSDERNFTWTVGGFAPLAAAAPSARYRRVSGTQAGSGWLGAWAVSRRLAAMLCSLANNFDNQFTILLLIPLRLATGRPFVRP